MPARFVTTSLVTKREGIAAGFVTLVTKRAVVTKRAATGSCVAFANKTTNQAIYFYHFIAWGLGWVGSNPSKNRILSG